MGTATYRRDSSAVNPTSPYFDREASLFTWFLLYVWDNIKPRRNTDAHAKPASVHQVLLAVRREHKLAKLEHCLIPNSAVVTVVKGMTLWFRDTYGPEALLPHRKEPIPYVVVDIILWFEDGTQVGTATVDNQSFYWMSLKALIALFKVTGYRKAEASIRSLTDTNVEYLLTRGSVVWFINTTEVCEPTPDVIEFIISLLGSPMESSVIMGVAPPPSKADQTGDRYGNFFAYVKLENVPTNAAFQMLRMERYFPVAARAARKAMPLFGPTAGMAFTHSQLDAVLPQMLRTVAENHPLALQLEHISRYSWHSFRIALACALKSLTLSDGTQAVTDATIQALCRWATPQSLNAYARINRSQYAGIIQKAGDVVFDSVQAATLWKQSPVIDDDARYYMMEAWATKEANKNDG